MTELQSLWLGAESLTAAWSVALTVGYLGNHQPDIAASWADGREWLTARRAGWYVAQDRAARTLHKRARIARDITRPGHGRHRQVAT